MKKLKFNELPKVTEMQTDGIEIWTQACQTSSLILLVSKHGYQLVLVLLFYVSLTNPIHLSYDSS